MTATLSQSSLRLTPLFTSILVNDQPLPGRVFSIDVTYRECEHDLAVIRVNSGSRAVDFDTLPGQRVEFDFGHARNSKKFQGYVSSVTPQQRWVDTTNIDDQVITCLGPSMVFKGNRPRFMTESTCTDAIARIVGDKQMGFHDEYRNDTLQWRALAQTAESDWQMILSLSNRIGAHVVTSLGVVRLIDYNDVVNRQLPSRFFMRDLSGLIPSTRDEPILPQGSLIDFTPTNITNRDPMYRVPSMAYLSGAQSAVVAGHTAQGVGRFATSMPAASAQEAEVLQQGYYLPDWSQSATLRCTGDATIEPAMTVQVSSTQLAASTMETVYDGVWYVQGIQHNVSGMNFQTQLFLGRVTNRATTWYQQRNFWMGDQRGIPQLLVSPDRQAWISSWR